MSSYIEHDHNDDGMDRRGFLKCMAWAGTGLVWVMSGGVPKAVSLGNLGHLSAEEQHTLFFAQISDSHIGFSKAANADVTATLQAAVDRLNALPHRPALVLHTGDISHLSKPGEFDTADQVIRGIKTDRVFYVPGEHDVLNDNGGQYRQRYGKNTIGDGWYSFDHSGVHFIGLVNVLNLHAGGLGALGQSQIDWLRRDLSRLPASTPIVVFAHVPLWAVYPEWGWGTDDSQQALALLRRFGSVTVLNGHIHQIMQKVEGNLTFHTALSTAFPQPAPGTAPSPGPMTVDAGELRNFLGIRQVTYLEGNGTLATVDRTLSGNPLGDFARGGIGASGAGAPRKPGKNQVAIHNFAFTPATITVQHGTPVTWINRDDVPHLVASADNRFKSSGVLDTSQRFSTTFEKPGAYDYFCALHPKMTGRVVVL